MPYLNFGIFCDFWHFWKNTLMYVFPNCDWTKQANNTYEPILERGWIKVSHQSKKLTFLLKTTALKSLECGKLRNFVEISSHLAYVFREKNNLFKSHAILLLPNYCSLCNGFICIFILICSVTMKQNVHVSVFLKYISYTNMQKQANL